MKRLSFIRKLQKKNNYLYSIKEVKTTDKQEYYDFLKSKICVAKDTGIEISEDEVNPALKPHQRDSVIWAARGGRRAVFAAFGLGKTLIQLELCRIIQKREGGQALIVIPLGVKQEFIHDAVKILGIEAPPYVRNMAEIKEQSDSPILITNYERIRDGDIKPTYFTVCSLDEASCLRSYGSKTYQQFLTIFKGVKYKFCCTATPDPNKYKELIHYAGFLEVMDTGQALTRFFQRDSTKANNLTLYPHKEREFWLWVSSWALYYTKPSDLNPEYSDEGYILPPLKINYNKLISDTEETSIDKYGQMALFDDAARSLQDASRIKGNSIKQRISKAAEIVNANPNEHFVLWHDREEERHEINRQFSEVSEIYGSLDIDIREKRIIEFAEGNTRLLATKKSISGSGCNFQKHCHREIFCGIDYEFNDFIQAIHRCYRFLQTDEVVIDIIYMDTEEDILKVLLEKWDRYNYQMAQMVEIVKKYGLSTTNMETKLQRTIGVERVEIKGEHFTAVNNDSVLELERMEENSVDLVITSIPFSNHYEYTPSYNDLGHNEDNDKFFEQLDFMTPNVLRVLKPGRVAAIHVKDRILFGNATGDGMPTLDPFSDMTVFHFIKHGFKYMGRITVTTDVVRENNQTYRLGWTEQCKDGTKMGVGCPEYILLFRKLPTDTSRAYADEPVSKPKTEYTRGQWQLDAHAFWRSSGDRLLTKEEIMRTPTGKLGRIYRKFSQANIYNYSEHVELANKLDEQDKLPATFMVIAPAALNDTVWDDIVRMRTLNSEQKRRDLQLHVCPLQLDIIQRLITRFSNEGETVLDYFGGIMSVPYMAVKMGRYGIGIELNNQYFRDGVGYLKAEEERQQIPTLFDFEMQSEEENDTQEDNK